MSEETTERACPYCMETISSRAVICHYCASGITPAIPRHGGTCPFCDEAIRVDAVKCRYCKSMVGSDIARPGSGRDGLRFAASGAGDCYAQCFFAFPFDFAKQDACKAGCDFHPHLVKSRLVVR